MQASQRLNIVFLTIDECKATALTCYGNGDAVTPNIDRLADEGVLFQNTFTTMPKCTPARCSLITGRYAHVEGHRSISGLEVQQWENNMVTEFKKLGYRTGMFGKNHTVSQACRDLCFDEYTQSDKVLKKKEYGKRQMNENDYPPLFRAHYRYETVQEQDLVDTAHLEDGCNFIKRNKEKPFFVLFNLNMPHPAYVNVAPYIDTIRNRKIKLPSREEINKAPEVLKRYREIYDLEMLSDDDWRKIIEAYYSMVSFSDACVGKIMQTLRNEGLDENTLVVFTSDHGDFAGEHGAVEKYDTMFYDCLTRVPLIFRRPGRIKEGIRLSAMVENVDIMPTILELCGLNVPEWVQGKSLKQLIDGEKTEHRSEVFSEGGVEEHAIKRAYSYENEHYKKHPNYYYKQKVMVDYPFTMYRSKMVRTSKWKLIFRVNGMKELFDLENDPMELSDVSGNPENREIIYELMEKLLVWSIKTETDYPEIKVLHA